MRARVPMSTVSRSAMIREIQRELVEWTDAHSKELDAIYLLKLHQKKGWGKKRLEDYWREIWLEVRELKERYELEEVGLVAKDQLKRIGVDLDELYKEMERTMNNKR